MAITSLDGVIANMEAAVPFVKAASQALVVGRPHSFFLLPGAPGPAAAVSTTTGGGIALASSTTSTIPGQLYHLDPGSGNAYLARLSATATQAGMLLLCDRLLHCGSSSTNVALSATITATAQAVTTTTLPARDANGTTAGVGVLAAIEILTNAGAGTPNATTISYVNSAGAGGTGLLVDTWTASPVSGAFMRFGLASGDAGIRSVLNVSLSATITSGTFAVVLYRVLAALELPGALIPNAIDALTAGFPRLYNGVVPFFVFIPNAVTATALTGTYIETQG